jgi:hypothetical protein
MSAADARIRNGPPSAEIQPLSLDRWRGARNDRV